MFEMGVKCEWCDVRVNSLRIVSTIGALLAKSIEPNPVLKVWQDILISRQTYFSAKFSSHYFSLCMGHLVFYSRQLIATRLCVKIMW